MDHRNLVLTERERCERDCIARLDYDRSQVSRESNGENFLLVLPAGFGISQRTEYAFDFICALDRFHKQIVSKYDFQIVVLDIEVEGMGRFLPVYAGFQ